MEERRTVHLREWVLNYLLRSNVEAKLVSFSTHCLSSFSWMRGNVIQIQILFLTTVGPLYRVKK